MAVHIPPLQPEERRLCHRAIALEAQAEEMSRLPKEVRRWSPVPQRSAAPGMAHEVLKWVPGILYKYVSIYVCIYNYRSIYIYTINIWIYICISIISVYIVYIITYIHMCVYNTSMYLCLLFAQLSKVDLSKHISTYLLRVSLVKLGDWCDCWKIQPVVQHIKKGGSVENCNSWPQKIMRFYHWTCSHRCLA